MGCRRREQPLTGSQLSRKLKAYSFMGDTGRFLKKYCPVDALPAGQSGWVCAKTYLDWYLVGAIHADQQSIERLARALGISCPKENLGCGIRVVERLDSLFAQLQEGKSGGTLRWRAESARKLLSLQLEGAARWDGAYLRGIGALARSGPISVEASVVVMGALADAVGKLAKAKLWQRPNLLARLLGFACPADQPETCPFGCPELTARLVQTRPELRKRLIALHCPLKRLGFTDRKQTVFLSDSSQRLARNLSFLTETLTELTRSADPLALRLRPEIEKLSNQLDRIVFPLPIPELSPTERGYRKMAFCGAAFEQATAPVFVSLGPSETSAGIAPLLHSRQGRLVVPGMADSLVFPGRPVPTFDRTSLDRALSQAEQVWKQESGLPASGLVALVVDARVDAGRFHRLMTILAETGRTKQRLLFRNIQGARGGLTTQVVPCPPKQPRWKSRLEKTLAIWVDASSVLATSAEGPLAEKPFSGPVTDLAGLRAALEHTRRAYRDIQSATVFVGPGLRYLDFARILASAIRNSSGRTLYATISLSACPYSGKTR